MKITWLGNVEKCINENKQEKLPLNAVKFKEANSMWELIVGVIVFCIPIIIFMIVIKNVKGVVILQLREYLWIWILWVSISSALQSIMQIISLPKNAHITFSYSLKTLGIMMAITSPMSKKQFIFYSTIPIMIFVIIPIIVWLFLHIESDKVNSVLFTVILMNIFGNAINCLNAINAFRQMPKGSVTQMSGLNSYWYMP